MDARQHHIQDSCERYAVHLLEALAEQAELSRDRDSDAKLHAFRAYAAADDRRLVDADFRTGRHSNYIAALERFLPAFFRRLTDALEPRHISFRHTAKGERRANRKADFVVETESRTIGFSLKNYKNAESVQVCSGTFNSFVLNFLFEPAGVGLFRHPQTAEAFRGADVHIRDAAVRTAGFGPIVPLLRELDDLQTRVRTRLIDGPEFEHFDADAYREIRREAGTLGAVTSSNILRQLDDARIRRRILKLSGLGGDEEQLILDPHRASDSLTYGGFASMIDACRDESATVELCRRGQSILFTIRSAERDAATVQIPFTLNSNGAWHRPSDRYTGTQHHAKENVALRWGERRPKKSRELATSVNAWINLKHAGVFSDTYAV